MKIQSAIVLGALLTATMPALKAQVCQPVLVFQHITAPVATVIQGNIENKAGTLVAGLSLTITGSAKPKLQQTVVTDDNGQFHFDSVPAGKYTITIEHTAGTAKRTEVECDRNGVCQMVFILKPARKPDDCRNIHYQDRGATIRQ